MNFRQPTVNTQNTVSKKKVGKIQIVSYSVFFLLLLTMFLYVGFQMFTTFDRIKGNWTEIQFAYSKPAIVKIIRQDYEKKTTAIEQSYGEKKITAQDRLINAVSDQLNQSK